VTRRSPSASMRASSGATTVVLPAIHERFRSPGTEHAKYGIAAKWD
jgi:hypothetical protein